MPIGRPVAEPTNRTFLWLWMGAFISALATFVSPFLALFLTSRGYSPARAGVFAACFRAGALSTIPFSGVLADHFGRRPTLLGALCLSALSATVLAFASSPVAIAATVFAFGAGTGSARPPLRAMVGDLVEPPRLRKAFGMVYWAENVGASVSLAVGGLLASRGWALPFLLDATTTLAFAAVVLLRVPETHHRDRDTIGLPGYGVVLHDVACMSLLGLYVLYNVTYAQTHVALAIDMARQGFSHSEVGAVLAVSALTVAVVQPVAPRLLARMTHAECLAMGALMTGLGLGLQFLCVTVMHRALAAVVWALGEVAFFGNASALVTSLSSKGGRGRYAGASGFCFSASTLVAALLGPSILQAWGPRALWCGCLGVGVLAMVGLLVWERWVGSGGGRSSPAGQTIT